MTRILIWHKYKYTVHKLPNPTDVWPVWIMTVQNLGTWWLDQGCNPAAGSSQHCALPRELWGAKWSELDCNEILAKMGEIQQSELAYRLTNNNIMKRHPTKTVNTSTSRIVFLSKPHGSHGDSALGPLLATASPGTLWRRWGWVHQTRCWAEHKMPLPMGGDLRGC